MPFSRGSTPLRDQTWVSHIAASSLPSELPGKPLCYSRGHQMSKHNYETELTQLVELWQRCKVSWASLVTQW